LRTWSSGVYVRRVYKASECARNHPRSDRRHHPHRSYTAAHLEAARHDSRPARVRPLREGACQRSLGHGMLHSLLLSSSVVVVEKERANARWDMVCYVRCCYHLLSSLLFWSTFALQISVYSTTSLLSLMMVLQAADVVLAASSV